MPPAGFDYRYREHGGRPTVRRLDCSEPTGVHPGDIVSVEGNRVAFPRRGQRALLGAILPGLAGSASGCNVVTDPDAVYAVSDPEPRVVGTHLCLSGATGCQHVEPERRGELVVVDDCPQDDETLVRIRFDCHHDVVVRSPVGATTLSPEREQMLVLAAAAGDQEASGQVVEAFLPAVSHIARLYRGAVVVNREELTQAGIVGLLRAVRRFDPDLGNPFWAYAAWWVRQGMQALVSELGRPTVLSDRAMRGLARVNFARAGFLRTHHREATSAELAVATGLTREQVEPLLVVEHVPRAFEEPIGDDEGSSATVGDQLADPSAEDAYEKVLERLEIEQVRDLTTLLTEREREILFDHYGFGRSPQTLREIGDRIGVSAERVRQIEEASLRKLRDGVTSGAA